MQYSLSAQITVTAYTVVEADTPEEAVLAAENRDCCFDGFGYPDNEYWIVEEIDGIPQNIYVEE